MPSRRITANAWIPLLVIACLVQSARPDSSGLSFAAETAPQRGQRAEDPGARFFDGFEGKFALDWQPLRADPTHFSLEKHPGMLTIVTQLGGIHRDALGRGLPPAKNIFLLDNPWPDECGFVVTTCIHSFQPTRPWQQAGLISYDDDDNYVKWVCQSSREGEPEWNLLRETAGKSRYTKHVIDHSLEGKVWLRVTVRGNHHEYATSVDGKTFTTHGELTWGEGPPKKIGLVAKNGDRQDTPEKEANFDMFELRPLNQSEKEQPAFVERQMLKGKWVVRSCRVSGKDLADAPLSQFVFTDVKVTLTEKGKNIEAAYSLDVSSDPKRISLTFQDVNRSGTLLFVYAKRGDSLLLCCDLRQGATPPADLKTNEGDGRLLAVLKREAP
jgi:uncharacterized protein (TIGR03067 family)